MHTSKKRADAIPDHFAELGIALASPERILEWSHGEVTKPETINYRTQRPEKSGLFDEKIFGPERDFECYCGKYRGIRFKGIICEKCGVEITRAIVRRERMGHIDLASPVAHIWFLRGIPSRIALFLGLPAGEVENVVYFAGYIVTRVLQDERERLLKDLEAEFQAKLKGVNNPEAKEEVRDRAAAAKRDIERIREGMILDEATYHTFAIKYGAMFEAQIGAEALYTILKNTDLEALVAQLDKDLETAGTADREKIKKRRALVESMRRAGTRPEWMFMTRLPVVPPALRPMVALEGGRHASSDINDLYRRVINRNNRLKKLQAINAPEVILRNEKRILQEAVDALLDNSMRRSSSLSGLGAASRRSLKSLADYLSGKHGYFRQNLLGKRVDYSGRSVIVVGPTLALDECGMPKHMALELFRPFVIRELLARELAYNIRGAGRLIEEGVPEVWAILEEVIEDKHVLLNRQPTLHRQSMQAFRPILIEGSALQLHPLVCPAFNADFDGDQMAVHVPLSEEAQLEAANIMSANRNILKPGSGEVVVGSKLLDIILGCYWVTKVVEGAHGEGKAFPNPNAAITACDFGAVDLRARIKVLPTDSAKYAQFNGEVFETTVGRLLFNSMLPTDFPFVNDTIAKKQMDALINDLVYHYSLERMPAIFDKIKAFGFKYATAAGITWSYSDIAVPAEKKQIIEEGRAAIAELWNQYNEGFITDDERYVKATQVWEKAKGRVQEAVINNLNPKSPVSDMILSKARGSTAQLVQMAGMKGLIVNSRNETIEFPVLASMKEGFSPAEYFISTHGSRKGLADTALNTAKAGYLTRRLFDVAQDVIVTEDDCQIKEGIEIVRPADKALGGSFADKLVNRVLAQDAIDNGEVVFPRNHMLTHDDARAVEKSSISAVTVRSPMTCHTKRGVCRHCYGADLTTGKLIDIGEAVGIVAAQAIGEPGTQLTMRTFHTGGVAAAGGDITVGLPRVEEIFERRKPKIPASIAHLDGVIADIIKDNGETVISILPNGGEKVAKRDAQYSVHPARTIIVKRGDSVKKGDFLTDGSADISEIFDYAGKEAAQEYIIKEITRIYELQGVTISRKHLEIIVKQMFSRVEIKSIGGTQFSLGEIVEEAVLADANEAAKERGDEPATGERLVLGIADVALTRVSFLSTISFQHTTRKLTDAAIAGAVDKLVGLKENVILGRLIPAGTGFGGSTKNHMIRELQQKIEAEEMARAAMLGEETEVEA